MAFLVVARGPEPGRVILLIQREVVLGRGADCDAVLKSMVVGRQHARVVREGEVHVLEDLDSRGSTYVNDQRAPDRTRLRNGDVIRLGDYQLVYHEEPAAEDGEEIVEATVHEQSFCGPPVQGVLGQRPPTEAPKGVSQGLLQLAQQLMAAEELDRLLGRAAGALLDLFSQADRCFILLPGRPGEPLVPRVVRARRAVAMPARVSRKLIARCVESGRVVLAEGTYGGPPARWRSLLSAPLRVGRTPALGALQLDTQDWVRPFVRADLEILGEAAILIALAVQAARWRDDQREQARLEVELRLARSIQRSFQPRRFPGVPGYDLFCHVEPAPGRGGLHDVFSLPGGRVGLLVGEVGGRGFPAALLAARLGIDARLALIDDPDDPARALGRVNEVATAGSLDRVLNLVAGTLEPTRHACTLAVAGHTPPLLYRHAGRTLRDAVAPDQVAPALGIRKNWKGAAVTVALAPGDCLLVASEGVAGPIGRKGDLFQADAFRAAAAGGGTVAALLQRVVQAVHDRLGGAVPSEDLTVICLGRPLVSAG
ncbi:MAG: SpoIIE family protein phosphatase [Gemmataceae bacterium]|nr:SpoIIE family protein phosphatase [Gemmataceae bacterium]